MPAALTPPADGFDEPGRVAFAPAG